MNLEDIGVTILQDWDLRVIIYNIDPAEILGECCFNFPYSGLHPEGIRDLAMIIKNKLGNVDRAGIEECVNKAVIEYFRKSHPFQASFAKT